MQALDSLLLVPIGPKMRAIVAPIVFDTSLERMVSLTQWLEALAIKDERADATYRLARLGLATLNTLRSDALELEQMRKELADA